MATLTNYYSSTAPSTHILFSGFRKIRRAGNSKRSGLIIRRRYIEEKEEEAFNSPGNRVQTGFLVILNFLLQIRDVPRTPTECDYKREHKHGTKSAKVLCVCLGPSAPHHASNLPTTPSCPWPKKAWCPEFSVSCIFSTVCLFSF